jgi:hypothetical protein
MVVSADIGHEFRRGITKVGGRAERWHVCDQAIGPRDLVRLQKVRIERPTHGLSGGLWLRPGRVHHHDELGDGRDVSDRGRARTIWPASDRPRIGDVVYPLPATPLRKLPLGGIIHD